MFVRVLLWLPGCCYVYQGVASMLLRLPLCCYGWHGVNMVARMSSWLAWCCYVFARVLLYVCQGVAMCLPGCYYGCKGVAMWLVIACDAPHFG